MRPGQKQRVSYLFDMKEGYLFDTLRAKACFMALQQDCFQVKQLQLQPT
jgi:hypothetical protein